MTKHWTIKLIIAISLLSSCGESDRRQLTGTDKTPELIVEKNLAIERVEPNKTKVEILLEQGLISQKSSLKDEEQISLMNRHLSETNVFTGFIINNFRNNKANRDSIVVLTIEPSDESEDVIIQITTGKGEISTYEYNEKDKEIIEIKNNKISLHKREECLIIERDERSRSAVVCRKSSYPKVNPEEVSEKDKEVEKIDDKEEIQPVTSEDDDLIENEKNNII